MPYLLWDASGLAKRYYPEVGTDTVNAIFSLVSTSLMTISYIGYAETAAILRRNFNRGEIDQTAFTQARAALGNEVLLDARFGLLTMDDRDILDGISLTDQYNINTTDASILAAYLRFSRAQQAGSPSCLLIASDLRLIRAASAEGLSALSPETVSAADIPALLTSHA